MQPFYLSKNSSGFYKVYFVNTETGKVIATKSTHSTNKFEATQIASNWHLHGLLSARTTPYSNYKNNSAPSSGMDLQSIVNRLAKEKKIPHINYGRHILFRKIDLFNWLGSMVCEVS